jgi:LDH2 family malate/lactate/ureidoglycolate dehydrogenase
MVLRVISSEKLKRFCEEALERVGVPASAAAVMAQIMVEADLKGVETHGTAKLRGYITLMRKGDLNPTAVPKIHRETPTTAVIDGDRCASGFAAQTAMRLAIDKARKVSIAAVAVRNVGRCGALSTFTSMAAEEGLIGFMTAQGAHVVPPYGGKTKMLNTSPWSFAIPAGDELPILLDMSSTEAAHSKIELAAKEQRSIPYGWLLNAAGEPTTDPNDLEEGFQTWIGGPKGYGLAVVDQVLAGILGGAPMFGIVPGAIDVHNRGHFITVIDPGAFMEPADFRREVDALIRRLKSSERIAQDSEILLPGERSLTTKRKRLETGIPVRAVVWKELSSLANDLGLSLMPDQQIATASAH